MCDKSQVIFLHAGSNYNAVWLGKGEERQAGNRGAMLQGLELSGGSLPVHGSLGRTPILACPSKVTEAGTTGPGVLLPLAVGLEGMFQDIPSLAGLSGDVLTQGCLNPARLLPVLLNSWPGTRSTLLVIPD